MFGSRYYAPLSMVIAGVVSVGAISLLGCAGEPSPPSSIIFNPEEPWEVDLDQEMLKRGLETPTPTPVVATWSSSPEEGADDEEGGWLTVIADIIAFPFRGLAWLARTIF